MTLRYMDYTTNDIVSQLKSKVIMLKEEFEKIVGYEVADSVYSEIEAAYMAAGEMDKKDFCKEFKEHQLNKSEVFWEIVKTVTKTKNDSDFYEKQFNEMKEKMEKQLAEKGLKWNEEDEVLEEIPAYERIKTVEDALLALGTPDEEVKDFFKPLEKWGADMVAYAKLRVIVEAINDGWKPKFVVGESRYYPWFLLYKDIDAAKADGYDENDIYELPAVVGSADSGGDFGVSVLASYSVASYSHPYYGGALALRDRDRAIYCGKQFIAEWMEYYVTRK